MNAGLDGQVGDLAWSIATGLRAGYDLRQVITTLTTEAPEPSASACKLLLAELDRGKELGPALAGWKKMLPSASLARLVDTLESHHAAGGSLPQLLDVLSEELVRECGSDPAFYEAMRTEARNLGAKVPERVVNSKK